MSRKKKDDKIEGFKSLTTFEASTAKEGRVTTHKYKNWSIRRVIQDGQPWFSVVDMIAALTESDNPNSYWGKLKERMIRDEGAWEPLTKCQRLKLPAPDGKMRQTDCATMQTLFRIIESVPSPHAEPIKQWLAQVGFERIQETAEPGRAVKRAVQTYRDKGLPDDWINNRLQNASAETDLHGEWDGRGVKPTSRPFIEKRMHTEALGITPQEHRDLKKIAKDQDLPDHMDGLELAIDTLGKEAAAALVRSQNTQGYEATRDASIGGAKIAGNARKDLENKLGRPVVSAHNALPKPGKTN